MKSLPPIITSGSIAIDRIMNFSGHFRDFIRADNLDTLSVSILLDDMHDSRGGTGANIAYSMALLGDTPILLGSAGSDAAVYLKELAKLGVDITHVFESSLPTATFTCFTDSDQNQFGGFYPGAMSDGQSLNLNSWQNQQPLVIISSQDPAVMRRLVAECQGWQLRLCYDVGQQVSNLPSGDLAAGVYTAEILILNDYELSALAAKTDRPLGQIKAEVPVMVTTFGKNGSIIEGAKVETPIQIGIARPAQEVDPTGAGDAYRAGFMYGYAREWGLKICGQLGAVCAAFAVETRGPQNHSFTFGEVKKRYEDNFGENLPGD